MGKAVEESEREDKDTEIVMIGIVDAGTMPIYVSINSWDGGPPKLSIIRRGVKKSGEHWFKPVGRMTEAEAKGLVALLSETLDQAFEFAKSGGEE